MKAPKRSQDQALALISAEVVNLGPGLEQLGRYAQDADDTTMAIAATMVCTLGALRIHLSHMMDSPAAEQAQGTPTKWSGPIKRAAPARRGGKRAAAQAGA